MTSTCEWESSIEIREGVLMKGADLLLLQKGVLEQQISIFCAATANRRAEVVL